MKTRYISYQMNDDGHINYNINKWIHWRILKTTEKLNSSQGSAVIMLWLLTVILNYLL